MGRKPVIGITLAHCTEELKTFPRAFYVEIVKKLGGRPVLLPLANEMEEVQEVLELIDGLILSGGGDITPTLLGELPRHGIGDCFPERDLSEILMAQAAMKINLPILGICRGIQVLAVAAGGKIFQDISTQYPGAMQHKQTAPREYAWHKVELLESRLRDLFGQNTIGVNSIHHQAVSNIPDGFQVNAVAPDGVIEGIEKVGARFCLGVQWHPEAMIREKHSQIIFKELIETSSKN